VFRAAVLCSVRVGVAEVPRVGWQDLFVASGAVHAPGCDDRRPPCSQTLVVCTVSALGSGAAGTPAGATAVLTSSAAMSCEVPCRAWPAVAKARLLHLNLAAQRVLVNNRRRQDSNSDPSIRESPVLPGNREPFELQRGAIPSQVNLTIITACIKVCWFACCPQAAQTGLDQSTRVT
jgi:hypothetical protein